jgi:prepilin-type N-terminal cleavage/methylation domain-containing protein
MISKSKNKQSGFSLLEVILAIGIMGLILVALIRLIGNSTSVSQLVTSQAAMQSELRTAGAIIGDSIQRSSYVFPPQGSTLNTTSTPVIVNWSSFNLGSGNRKTGPHNSTTFEVTSSISSTRPPFLAMIVAPRNPSFPCKATDTSTDVFRNGEGCYSFVAYYPVIRPNVTQGMVSNSPTSNALLAPNSYENTRWVIMEAVTVLSDPIGGVPWNRVGCSSTQRALLSRCTVAQEPSSDPSTGNQNTINAIPAITCVNQCDVNSNYPSLGDVNLFASRMRAISTWMTSNPPRIRADILVENIDEEGPSGIYGFDIRMPEKTRDARGITQVRMRLRGKANTGGRESAFTADITGAPTEYFFSPRNIPPFIVSTVTN